MNERYMREETQEVRCIAPEIGRSENKLIKVSGCDQRVVLLSPEACLGIVADRVLTLLLLAPAAHSGNGLLKLPVGVTMY
jgi:hypothetical protein